MTANCELVTEWMKGNKLKLNASKTHLMTVGTGARLRSQASTVVVQTDGCVLEESADMEVDESIESCLTQILILGPAPSICLLAGELMNQLTHGQFLF
jgi:hypothetical protein